MGRLATILIALAALALPGTALAVTPIKMPEGKTWEHKQTKLKVPAAVDGFSRYEAADYGSTQSDVMFQYREASSETRVTLYLYRAGSASVPIWADRADAAIALNAASYGTLDKAGRRFSFYTPWSNAPNSAVRVVYPLSGKGVTATGLLLAQRGEWLIKVRMTSNRLDAATVETRLASFFAGLAFKPDKLGAEPAYAVQPCTDRLPATEAKLVERNDDDGVMGLALLNSVAPIVAKGKPEKAPIYCRDAASEAIYGVYRPGGATDRYLLTFGDGGVTIAVGRDSMGELVGKREARFSPTLYTAERTVGYAPYTALPSPKQIISGIDTAKPVWARSRLPGKEKEVQIIM